MKKIISLVLLVLIVASLVSCAGSTATTDNSAPDKIGTLESDKYKGEFRVGYSISSITPADPAVPLAGYGNEPNRICRGYLDELYTRATAISDKENNTVIVMQIDIINMVRGDIADKIFEGVSENCKVPVDNIIFNCSHTHSGPALNQNQMPIIKAYEPIFINTIVANAVKAMNDRAPASMAYGDTQVPDHNFVRHYYATDGNGDDRVVGDNHWDVWFADLPDNSGKKYIDHADKIDQTFHIIKFDRKDADDVMWMSFRAHNTITGDAQQYLMSSDWTGKLCEYVEEQMPGTKCMYLQGDAGNVNPSTRMKDREKSYVTGNKETIDDLVNYSSTLAPYAVDLAKNLKDVPTGLVGGKRFSIMLKVNHDRDNLKSKALLVQDYWKKTYDSTATKRYAYTLGLVSQYEASSIISNAKLGSEIEFKASAMVICGIGFTFSPGELFNQLGVDIKNRSPFKTTVSISYSGQTYGYIPDSATYDYGSYEVDTARQAKGSGEQLVDKFIDVLGELKNTVK
ncbi:MAG: neutral/alkaline non-lysosomal ceramidase N-terminal domain-containing protein [Clostridia bacterium]|nr:neutral/alkaline non-lysosomal ceramidase N-terminal domain-containing protein [Clostridia bacterium]